MRIVRVLVTAPIDKSYDYCVPDGMAVGIGDYVTVPLASRQVTGVVWELPDSVEAKHKTKAIIAKHDIPPMNDIMRGFIDWTAHYNMVPRGMILKMAVSVPDALTPPTSMTGYVLGDKPCDIDDLNNFMADGIPHRAVDITQSTGISAARIKTMVKNNILRTTNIFANYPCVNPNPDIARNVLSNAQQSAANKILNRIKNGGYETFLLDGVTGSGKTEVYFEAVAEAIRRGEQVVILMPEIALTTAFTNRFYKHFGVKPALWHSSLTPAARRLTWRGVAFGETKVVVGARSALFLPYQNLGLIVVDEEHDQSFKQEEVVIYNARDMAVVRAHRGKIPIVLVSATPSMETLQNAWDGRYNLLQLPSRYGGAEKPDITIIDLTKDQPERQHFLSPTLIKAMRETIDAKQQVMLFLNRRGFAPLTLCRTCGHRIECPKCTAWLVEHRMQNKLQCHHCGYAMKTLSICPKCEDKDSMFACGPGVERIEEEVREYFEGARTIVLASDITDTNEKLVTALQSIHNGEVDVIIGTQIMAKGHHFPKITCVGIVDADLGLSGGDLRASERSFQLLHQVAGRAGREQLKGRVFLQTYNAGQRVMQMLASDNRDGFMTVEAAERVKANMPPASRLAAFVISGEVEAQTKDVAMMIGRAAPRAEGLRVLGPAPAQMYRIRGQYRQRILIQAAKNIDIQKVIKGWLEQLKIPSSVRVTIDIDPISFL